MAGLRHQLIVPNEIRNRLAAGQPGSFLAVRRNEPDSVLVGRSGGSLDWSQALRLPVDLPATQISAGFWRAGLLCLGRDALERWQRLGGSANGNRQGVEVKFSTLGWCSTRC